MSPAPSSTVDQARIDIVEAADALFYTCGISAVRIVDIRDRSGVSLRRLYSLFPHKADLVTGWLEHRHTAWLDMFADGIDHRLAQGQPPIDAVFGSLERWLTVTNFRGCGFINTLAETGEVTDEHRHIIRHHKQTLVDSLARFADEPAALGVLLDGAIVHAAVFESTDPVAAARIAAIPLFNR